jgi:hypothetical protein
MIFWIKRTQIPTSIKINAVLISPIFFIGTSFHYYLFVIGIIFVSILIENRAEPESQHCDSNLDKSYRLISQFLFLIVLIPWALPWSLLPGISASRGWPVISMQWLLGQVAFTLYTLSTCYIYPIVNAKLRK